ncbi:hypothetical protein BDZ89DRAFT_1023836 [Hymenopellis radicata]|nr:hypothetical protein BDZ89DRAFT_1023836 [Hymenopellis radicata]
MAQKTKDEPVVERAAELDDSPPTPAISVPETGDTGEGGKLKMIVSLVKKCLGVKDIATMRLSLPASLLEPIPNLEWSQYLDRPDLFAAVNDSDDPFERMLAVLRFTFTKDLKYVSGRVFKPYNSVLGEHFRAHWDVVPVEYQNPPIVASSSKSVSNLNVDTASVKSGKSSKSAFSVISSRKSPSTAATSLGDDALNAQMSNLNLQSNKIRIVYVTEQVSHHPPVSAYFATCPARSLELSGIDQVSAKVAGTTIKVSPGGYNKGLFVHIKDGNGKGEKYQVTHPVASVNGILRGSFYITVGDTTIVSCTGGKPGSKFRAITEYKEESWLGKARFRLEGIIHLVHEADTAKAEGWKSIKDVPHSLVVAEFDGSWRGAIRWRRVGSGSYMNTTSSSSSSPDLSIDSEYETLIDLSKLEVIPKQVRPLAKQLPDESRKLWETVTNKMVNKEFGDATKEKVAIEQRQRDAAAERKKTGVEFVPRYFDKDISSGVAILTEEGRKAVEEELAEPHAYHIVGSEGAKLGAS